MRAFNNKLIFSVFIVIFLFLFLRTNSINITEFQDMGLRLRELRELNTTLNQDVLRLRIGDLKSYDPLSHTLRRLVEIASTLDESQLQHSPIFKNELVFYRKFLNERETIVEELKSENAKLQNSSRYFPSIVRNIHGTISESKKNKFLENILIYSLYPDEASRDLALKTVSDLKIGLKSHPTLSTEDLRQAVAHADLILEKRDSVDRLLSQFLNSPVRASGEKLFHSFSKYQENMIHESNFYRFFFILISFFLIGYVLYTLVKLHKLTLALNESNEMLEKRVGERTVELQKSNQALILANDEAMQASKVKTSFLTNMSHELRTPLNAILGYSEILLEEESEKLNEKSISDLCEIQSAGKHLLRLIGDILDLSKIESGKMQLNTEIFDIAGAVKDMTHLLNPIMKENNNELIVDCQENMGEMNGDLTKITQVIFNLLNNATKFTRNGVVTLTVRHMFEKSQRWVEFRVKDTGIGISPENQEKIFEEFNQVDNSTTRKYGGAGLGLAISRRFCELMKGHIYVESEVNKGSIFTVRFPKKM
ncbi:MAG: DAHL domain-containing protein [Elusimicrobiota bacterium]